MVLPAQALNSIPRARAEWILWLDMDMVLEDVTFTLPLASYAGRDLVMWGQPEWIMRGDNARGARPFIKPLCMHKKSLNFHLMFEACQAECCCMQAVTCCQHLLCVAGSSCLHLAC
jgi:hypothetical protein